MAVLSYTHALSMICAEQIIDKLNRCLPWAAHHVQKMNIKIIGKSVIQFIGTAFHFHSIPSYFNFAPNLSPQICFYKDNDQILYHGNENIFLLQETDGFRSLSR